MKYKITKTNKKALLLSNAILLEDHGRIYVIFNPDTENQHTWLLLHTVTNEIWNITEYNLIPFDNTDAQFNEMLYKLLRSY